MDMLPVYIVLIIFCFLAFLVKTERDLKREKIRTESGGQSLGTSELWGLIQETVHDANSTLEERLE